MEVQNAPVAGASNPRNIPERPSNRQTPPVSSLSVASEPPKNRLRKGQITLDTFSPVNQNGSFEFDRVLKSGYVQKRTRKTKVGLYCDAVFQEAQLRDYVGVEAHLSCPPPKPSLDIQRPKRSQIAPQDPSLRPYRCSLIKGSQAQAPECFRPLLTVPELSPRSKLKRGCR
jgi:hypothetical protein